MSLDADEEILQDFLVEAGEILELLGEQLVEMENKPDDKDLLNSIFRGFHTVKGGAGFLQLGPLVDCCHVAENVFDILRNGQRRVSTELMDVVLRALDTVNEMFDTVRAGEMPGPCDPQLIEDLSRYSQPESADEAAAVQAATAETVIPEATAPEAAIPEETVSEAESSTPVTPESFLAAEGDITDEEFEGLLDALEEPKAGKAEPVANVGVAPTVTGSGDEITEDEFDALLDQLHGSGGPSSVSKDTEKAAEPAPVVGVGGDENISESEFEELLDKLHGKGKGPTEIGSTSAEVTPAEVTPAAATPPPPPPPEVVNKTVEAPQVDPAKPVKKAEPPAAAEATVRVDTKRLDDIMNMVGELVLVRNRLVRLGLKFRCGNG